VSRAPSVAGNKRWTALLALVGLALGQAVTMVVTAFATRDVIAALRAGDGSVPLPALAAIAAAGAIVFGLRAAEGALGERTGQSYAADIRRALFLHLSKMPLSAVAERRAGAMALRFVGDLSAFKGWVARGVARMVSACFTIPTAFLILFLLDPQLALVAAGPIGGTMAIIFLLGRPLGRAHASLRQKRARLAANMAERLPQGIALRRSGRIKSELRALDQQLREIRRAAVWRAWLADGVRALPDAAAGAAGALCLWVCLVRGLGVADAVAALTALALIVWPLRHLADVRDRHQAFCVARAKLATALSSPSLPVLAKRAGDPEAPALRLDAVPVASGQTVSVTLSRGEIRRLTGPPGSGKSHLLMTLAGLEQRPCTGLIDVLGTDPGASKTGEVLYLGPHAPMLKGSLRRAVILGTARVPADADLLALLEHAGLADMVTRLGGLSGRVSEGARNLTATERRRLLLVRGLVARPELALVDADELGFDRAALLRLVSHFKACGTAALVVTAACNPLPGTEPAIALPAKEPRATRAPARILAC